MTAAPKSDPRRSRRTAIAVCRPGPNGGKADVLWEETDEHASVQSEAFGRFIQVPADQHKERQAEAQKGFAYIPRRDLIPVKTASDICNWMAWETGINPFVVYQRKAEPNKARIFFQIPLNTLHLKGTGVAYA